MKCRVETVFGWKVVEWNVLFPARFQAANSDRRAVKAPKGTARPANDSSKTTTSGTTSRKTPRAPPRRHARLSRSTHVMTAGL